ncbi:MAG: dTMP kinase [Candidatus Omnitrophica bacterium]|nr:dTMP kinase [Candidatus Omnitrophota bacterium]
MKKGKFITFEGPEGCGKSTQSKLLYQYLKSKGKKVIYLREPGGVRTSEKIRKLLLDPQSNISPEAETLLYMAARAEVVRQIIKPALDVGKIVVCDRFLDSTVAYQGFGLGININAIRSIGSFATCGIKPDMTILLDLPVKKGLKHREFIEDRIERRPLSYHMRVRRGYLAIARQEPKRVKIVKLDGDIAVTQDKIRKLCRSIL